KFQTVYVEDQWGRLVCYEPGWMPRDPTENCSFNIYYCENVILDPTENGCRHARCVAHPPRRAPCAPRRCCSWDRFRVWSGVVPKRLAPPVVRSVTPTKVDTGPCSSTHRVVSGSAGRIAMPRTSRSKHRNSE